MYVDHTLKSIQSSKNKKSLESINSNHKKINLMKIQKKKKTTSKIIHWSNTYIKRNLGEFDDSTSYDTTYIVSQPIDYRLDTFITFERNFIDMMT